MSLEIASFSIPKPGKENEDAVLAIESANAQMLAVADGVGGAEGGKDAAELALSLVRTYFDQEHEKIGGGLLEWVGRTFKERAIALERDFATTLTTCEIREHIATIEHVGDCRLYHLRQHGILTRTRDQTELQQLLDEGVLTPRAAKNYPRRNVLLSVLSAKGSFFIYQTTFELTVGDRLALVTDGVYKTIGKSRLRDISINCPTPGEFCDALLTALIASPIEDDCSALIADVTA